MTSRAFSSRVQSLAVNSFPARTALGVFCLASVACTTPQDNHNTESSPIEGDLTSRIEAQLDALDANSTLYAKHIPSGREVAIRADVPMNTLSVIKIPVMIQAFRDHESGRLNLDDRVVVESDDLRRGSGLLQTFAPGLNPTLRGLVTQMIVTSDNTATDMVIEAVGLDRVNALLDTEGYDETRLKLTTGQLFRHVWTRADAGNASMSDREVFERGFPSDPEASTRSFGIEGDSAIWLGRTTAREMGRLLEQVLDAELTSQPSSEEMIRILGRQLYSSRLPQRVQWQGVTVAHKTGDWPPIAGNDVGILFYDGGPTIVSAFTSQNQGDFFELEATLGRIAEDLVREWR